MSYMAIGDTASVLACMFGPPEHDAHMKAWEHHQFRLSDTGRAMMRRRLAATARNQQTPEGRAQNESTDREHRQWAESYGKPWPPYFCEDYV